MYSPQTRTCRSTTCRLVTTPNFERARKKLLRKNKVTRSKLELALQLLNRNPNHPSLSTHLVKVYKHDVYRYYASRVDFSYRILWYFDAAQRIVLTAVGPHDGALGVY